MTVLDRDRAHEALGARLADRFLQYAGAVTDGDARDLLMRIDEHLALVQQAAARRTETPGDRELAERVAVACKRLLLRCADLEGDARAAAVAAVRYFLDTHDLERDDEPFGFADDARVMGYVLAAVAPDIDPTQ